MYCAAVRSTVRRGICVRRRVSDTTQMSDTSRTDFGWCESCHSSVYAPWCREPCSIKSCSLAGPKSCLSLVLYSPASRSSSIPLACALPDRSCCRQIPMKEAPPRSWWKGLFGKYVISFVGLVVILLVVNGGLEAWFMYRDTTDLVVKASSAKGDATSQQIEHFVSEAERQI